MEWLTKVGLHATNKTAGQSLKMDTYTCIYFMMQNSDFIYMASYECFVLRPSGEAGTCRGSWFHVSDSSVKHVMESKVQSSQAYILFYERLL